MDARRSRWPRLCFALALAVLASPAFAQAPGPWYVRGTVFCSSAHQGSLPPDTCYGYGGDVELFDDGAHGDGAAGDGVWGVAVECNQPAGLQFFKIANADWSFAEPSAPSAPLVNGRAWVNGPGDIVQFRLDLNPPAYGWEPPIAVANDHSYPLGATLELMGSAPELGSWNVGLPADRVDSIWQKIVTIAAPGTYEYKFRVLGTWNGSNFGYDYNNNFGRNGTFVTTAPDTEMIIQFDELTGRIRAVPYADTPVMPLSWGLIKALYR